jgi:hypothetical protein
MIMPPNEHNAVVGAQPWVDPQNPGALQIPANATALLRSMKTSAQSHEESQLLHVESVLQRNRTGPVAKPNKCSPSCEKSMAQQRLELAPKVQQRLKLG